MLRLKYPSKEFASEWPAAHKDGKEYCVEARIGRFRRRSIQRFIDFMFGDGISTQSLAESRAGILMYVYPVR